MGTKATRLAPGSRVLVPGDGEGRPADQAIHREGQRKTTDHRGTQPVQFRHHDPAFDAPGHLVDEPRQAGIAAQPEDRDLRAQPGHLVEAAHREGDGARVRRVVEERLGPVAVLLEMGRRLTVGDDEDHWLRVGMTPQVPAGEQQRVVQVGALLVHAFQAGELGRRDRAGMPAKSDDLQRI